MKTAILAMSLTSALAAPVAAQTPFARAQAALDRWDITEARALAAKIPVADGRCVIEGVIANRENRLDQAVAILRPCQSQFATRDPALARTIYNMLYDGFLRAARYGDQYALAAERLQRFGATLPAEEVAKLRKDVSFAQALLQLPQRSVNWAGPTRVPTYLSALRVRHVDLTARNVKVSYVIDTGANFSVITASIARKMGLELHNPEITAAGSSGVDNPFHIAVIDELPIGSVTLRNVMVLVVPDAALMMKRASGDFQIEAALGYPELAALGHFSIDETGTMSIDPSAPLLAEGAHLYMKSQIPLVEGSVDGRPMVFELDTGAVETAFWAAYRDRYADAAKTWKAETKTSVGMGGSRPERVLIQPSATIRLDRWSAPHRDIRVEYDTAMPGIFGRVGQPIFAGARSYTIDFRSMRMLIAGAQPPG